MPPFSYPAPGFKRGTKTMRPNIDIGDRVRITYESVQNGTEKTCEGEVTDLTKVQGDVVLGFVLDLEEDNRYGDPILRHVRTASGTFDGEIVRDTFNDRKIGTLTGYTVVERTEAEQ